MSITKKFELNTTDIQHCIITLIESHCEGGHMSEHRESYDKLMDMLTEMNKLCWVGNDYTIKITAKP